MRAPRTPQRSLTWRGRIHNREPVPKVLVLNAGSSSLKWLVLDAHEELVVQEGTAKWDGTEGTRHDQELAGAFRRLSRTVDAVGHRVVHGGARFRDAVVVDDAVRQGIAELAAVAPLHNPAALAGIDAARRRFLDLPQVASFDTAFHSTIPEHAAVYPVPYSWTERWGLRRYGFHGLSVQFSTTRAAELLGAMPRRLVVCHLGAGCSVTAVREGRSVDTSMGFTPLEGLMMVRRSGSIDPGLLVYVLRSGLDVAELERGLNEDAGLAGVSGISSDMRAVLVAAAAGSTRAVLAIDMFVHRVVAMIGAMAAILGGLDAVVFTGGIGEHSATVRARVIDALGHLGARLDQAANESAVGDADVGAAGSAARVLVVTAREDLVILRDVKRLLRWGP